MPKTFTSEQIAEIERGLADDKLPEEIAPRVGVKPGSFRTILKDSGYRVRVRRELERIEAVPAAATQLAAVS